MYATHFRFLFVEMFEQHESFSSSGHCHCAVWSLSITHVSVRNGSMEAQRSELACGHRTLAHFKTCRRNFRFLQQENYSPAAWLWLLGTSCSGLKSAFVRLSHFLSVINLAVCLQQTSRAQITAPVSTLIITDLRKSSRKWAELHVWNSELIAGSFLKTQPKLRWWWWWRW